MSKCHSYVRGSLAERFWSKVNIGAANECWEWQASLDTRGYGNLGVAKPDGSGRFLTQRAHRIAWEITHGALPAGMLVCHRCDNRKCVNPAHLFLGDHKDNTRDCVAKGRLSNRKGVNNVRAKLTDECVKVIRSLDAPTATLSLLFGVSKSTILSVKSGTTWGMS